MDLSSYAGLKAAIAGFVNRADLSDAIPAFIALAEAQMNRRLRSRAMVGRSDAALAAGNEFLAVPADFIGPIDFVLKTTPLARLSFLESQTLLARKARERFASDAAPFAYALVGDEFQFLPAPAAAMDAELTYWKRPAPLSDGNTANWVLTRHPDIYLYGALVQSAPYLADDARTALWGTLFTQAIADANAADPSRMRKLSSPCRLCVMLITTDSRPHQGGRPPCACFDQSCLPAFCFRPPAAQ